MAYHYLEVIKESTSGHRSSRLFSSCHHNPWTPELTYVEKSCMDTKR